MRMIRIMKHEKDKSSANENLFHLINPNLGLKPPSLDE